MKPIAAILLPPADVCMLRRLGGHVDYCLFAALTA